jgi:D-alanine-D-alanine ligase
VSEVLVLGGGPDREREVSINSSRAIAAALKAAGHVVHYELIDRIGGAELARLPGDVVFPALHGAFGEGGPLQDLLEAVGRPFVGCYGRAARLAMDKVGTKLAAARLGIPTAPACVVNRSDRDLPIGLPLVMKPIHDGSSVGLHMCRDRAGYDRARGEVDRDIDANPGRAYMAESLIAGRELTQSLVVGASGRLEALDPIEIMPADGPYDFDAKYIRNDTRYKVGPDLPPGVADRVRDWSLSLAAEIGVRHLCRVDYILEADSDRAWLLELNTMPGFTDHSLVPMAARARRIEMPALCDRLVRAAMAEGLRPNGGMSR